ncbi:unnamed protein product [Darwinula stevensoni]|uniref:Cytochrome P450 n=1 Tax=Darwinula stevensoni TaxID=69355 RepID=A0A7R8X4Q0_9CRUS|nr:unnamed protein product [Darwinula stevensoni]CAG0879740.1 unnamed protein product [Darwinula stevensoni]
MPYTEAFIMESLRHGSLIPMGAPHVANNDTEINGYFIPKGTIVLGNIWSCHNDRRFWSDPEEFSPERFLDEDGKVKTNVSNFLPFGLGRRQCLGESLAKIELFLFMAIFMQKFTFCVPEGHPIPPREANGSFIINSPKPYKVLLKERLHDSRVHA